MIAAPHHVITVEEYHRMIDAGAFAPEARIELIDGELIAMAPMGNKHYLAVAELHEKILRQLSGRRDLRVVSQSPIILSPLDEPEPDVVISRRTQAKPQAAEVLLVIEVSDTTRQFDRTEKIPRYAKAGIPVAWLVDLTNDVVEVYTNPTPAGYGDLQVVDAAADLVIPVGEGSVHLPSVFGRESA